MQVIDETVGDVLVVKPGGRLDSNTSPSFEKHLLERLEGTTSLIVDFADLDYISSAGLRVLLMAAKRAKQTNGRMIICNLRGPIREVFEISGFMSILTVCDDRDAALAKVAA
ncbi:MAG: STAS domain-containing protein [Chromatiales bacterium]|jgi:anti-anti-sigma factor|nr:STAS domain-containing protein [Chromatiales bacterium]MDX9766234.1 STAS domain-containing protein [Ectothiorhodospiraceae bacterium]